MSKLNDLTGKKFGRLIVMARDKDKVYSSGRKVVMWKCKCVCGKECVVATTSLLNRLTKSCGCLNDEKRKSSETKYIIHGDKCKSSKYRNLYERWLRMKRRCSDKSNIYYGGRGIDICCEWKYNYINFRNWALTNGYKSDLTIDRIDVNKGYCPENCRWVTNKEQQNNKRNNKLIIYKGEVYTQQQLCDKYNINRKTFNDRLKRGMGIEEALNTPIRKTK